jgi:hypothetical protein
MLTGGPHGASMLARRETQMSKSPDRFDERNMLRPSREIVSSSSTASELITGPR